MPRLRRVKDYDISFNPNDFIVDDDEAHEVHEAASEQSNASVEGTLSESDDTSEFTGGQSWLSSASIISSLDDQKLHQAITYHRGMAKLLEEERVGRALGVRHRRHYHDPTWASDTRSGRRSLRSPSRRSAKAMGRKEKLIDSLLRSGVPHQLIQQLLSR